jgi:hypothetical protein
MEQLVDRLEQGVQRDQAEGAEVVAPGQYRLGAAEEVMAEERADDQQEEHPDPEQNRPPVRLFPGDQPLPRVSGSSTPHGSSFPCRRR